MADLSKYFPKVIEYEGAAFENVPGDNGGPTKYGVILEEWIKFGYDKNGDHKIDVNDLKLIDANDAMKIVKIYYWDKFQADLIINQKVAEIIVDWSYNCGTGLVTRKIQELLNTTVDGIFGKTTLGCINSTDPYILFNRIKKSRIDYYNAIVRAHPAQGKFLNGWLNRCNSFVYN